MTPTGPTARIIVTGGNGPVHAHGEARFARYPDGTEKRP